MSVRVPLGRQSLSGSLAFIFDQLPDPATAKPPPRLTINTGRPTYLAFDIQPVQDIGGTLTVALSLPAGLVRDAYCLVLTRPTHILPSGHIHNSYAILPT